MRLLTTFSTGLAFVATTIGVPVPIQTSTVSNVNITSLEYEDILGGFGLYNSSAITIMASQGVTYNPGDAVPFTRLPQCYQDCIESNCCNGWPSLGDVRRLTVDEWCRTKSIPVHAWLYEHLQFCIKDACRDCRPQCRDESIQWQNDVCANY
ncbi:hypothetical protein F5Y06DRAFT_298509 [Hypoxylon sp. FL0890]|nr:hypothetical protein F5Y06DRAFT_298509 [Hypoxylon sp. FL0890]